MLKELDWMERIGMKTTMVRYEHATRTFLKRLQFSRHMITESS